MASLLATISKHLDEQTIEQISQRVGADKRQTTRAVDAAIPLLVNALARNSTTPSGAQSLDRALERDHEGSLLDNLHAALATSDVERDGAAILDHVLGQKQAPVENGLSRATGLDSHSTPLLLQLLAPIVLEALGRQKRSQGLDAGNLATLLRREQEETETQVPGLAQLLDSDRDGQIHDDIIEQGADLLSGFLGRRQNR